MSESNIPAYYLGPGSNANWFFSPAMLEGVHAIFFDTESILPWRVDADLRDPTTSPFTAGMYQARQQGIPSFMTTADFFDREFVDPKIKKAEDEAGLVPLPVSVRQSYGVFRGLQVIMRNDGTVEEKVALAKDIFDGTDFHDKPEFLDLVINPRLKDFADHLPHDEGPIVVDCGHIDSPRYSPTDQDQRSLDEGLILAKYLQHIGHEDVRIGILVNEMHLFRTREKREARRFIRKLRGQVKRDGYHHLVDRVYRGIFQGFGFGPKKLAEMLVCSFEGSLNLRARQDLDAYETDGDHPFQTELDTHGERGYSFKTTLDDGRPFERVITSDGGAPMCALMSAELNRRYDEADVGRLVYLRDTQWRPGIRCGARSARALYGTEVPVDAFFYGAANGKVAIESHQRL